MMTRLMPKGFHFYEGEAKWLARGVTYGPFRPCDEAGAYPAEKAAEDFAAMRHAGCNAVRLYEMPPESLSLAAADHGLRLLVDIPWPKHIAVYGNREHEAMCIGMVEDGIRRLRDWPNLLGVFLGNEIPADIVRWAGQDRVRSFLARLYERAKDLAPDLPIGFANYPATEYLDLSFFDFLGFNIYLHDPVQFEDYLVRLRHLYPEQPLLLSEIGFDVQDHGEAEQKRLLVETLRVAYRVGVAGAFVFSWTDEWHTGGYDIHAWSFGLVDRERNPRPALQAVARVFASAPIGEPAGDLPRVSVVVASYNGARTLRQCLQSLRAQTYPDYEVIVVVDGSTDGTARILEDFPEMRVVSQPNRGLSAARNAGIEAATGELVAFTDDDCCADPDWLFHLARHFAEDGAAGFGGPNLTPHEDGLVAQSIALAPGHATHVLLSPREAEHVPGCNMAFRREALLAVNGFDPVFRKAGDDVDLIWRLQDLGCRVGFSTAAFVWHHRRISLGAYWRQQMGYGEAEALLLRKHPHRFNDRGDSLWRGTIYSDRNSRPLWGKPNVYQGVFCTSGYQCLYERRGSHLPYVFTSPEWWVFLLALAACGLFAPVAWWLAGAGAALSLGVSALKARAGWAGARSVSTAHKLLAWLLWVSQPIVRGGMRYRVRLRTAPPSPALQQASRHAGRRSRRRAGSVLVTEYWGESGADRLDVLRQWTAEMAQRQWFHTANSGWEPWDLVIGLTWWFKVRSVSTEENHGGNSRLLRFRFGLVPTSLLRIAMAAAAVLCGVVAFYDSLWARGLACGFLVVGWGLYRQALRRRTAVADLVDQLARRLGFAPLAAPTGAAASTDQTVTEHQADSLPAAQRQDAGA